MVICTLFSIWRQSSLIAHGDKTWSFAPFLLSRDNQVRWHTKTNDGHPHPFCYPEIIKSDGMQRQMMVIHTLFAIQRQSSPMARRDKLWSFAAPLLSRDNQVRWHTEADYGHLHLLCHPETIKSDGTQR